MTAQPNPSYGRLLLIGLALLVAGAVILLHTPNTTPLPGRDNARPAAASTVQTARPTTDRPETRPDHRGDSTAPDRHTTVATPGGGPAASPGPVRSDQPVSGDGPAGDYAIQRLLDHTAPTDLQPDTARRLTRLASQVWIAETTGAGRTAWPAYFTDTSLRAPYHEVRVQAAVAHQEGRRQGRVEVRLVWAGKDAAGEFRDGRTARVLLERHHNEWLPVR
ncbi:hypothetical protein ACIGHB_30025 [Streptomyces sp. NPDC085460]|uniref:hypothetical protein n=1 Tax=Streptomyces sp. NPDC085460 TaxID=3365723 RepID=UPI0037D2526E